MVSKDEKQRRREERLAREAAIRAGQARKRRILIIGSAVIATAIIAAIVLLVISSGGKDGDSVGESAAIPERKEADLRTAARSAGCTLRNPAIEGSQHFTKGFSPSDYKTNPPTSGSHNPNWAQDGIYPPGDTPPLGQIVHALEHGRIEIQYKKGTNPQFVRQLNTLFNEEQGYHMLLFENATGMRYAVAAAAWGHLLGCRRANDQVFDALRAFRDSYIDQGPENVP